MKRRKKKGKKKNHQQHPLHVTFYRCNEKIWSFIWYKINSIVCTKTWRNSATLTFDLPTQWTSQGQRLALFHLEPRGGRSSPRPRQVYWLCPFSLRIFSRFIAWNTNMFVITVLWQDILWSSISTESVTT